METKINGITVNVSPLGVVRWMGKWFTPYEVGANYILLDNEQFAASIEIRKQYNLNKDKKKNRKRKK